MLNLIKELHALQEEGKLHAKLILRISILFGISFATGTAVLYNILFRGAEWWIATLVALVGFIAGFFLFARMNVVKWDEGERLLTTARMDIAGFAILVLYVLFELGFKIFLNDFFPAEASAFILAAVFGTLFGRAVGTMFEIHRVYRATRNREQV